MALNCKCILKTKTNQAHTIMKIKDSDSYTLWVSRAFWFMFVLSKG